MQGKRFDTFISFNSMDRAAAQELHRLLQARSISAWLDEKDARSGVLAAQQLVSGIEKVCSVIVLIGQKGTGPWQEQEIAFAFQNAVDAKKPVIPVRLPGVGREKIPLVLRTFSDRAFLECLDTPGLLDGLEEDIMGSPPKTVRPREIEHLFRILKEVTIPNDIAYQTFTDLFPVFDDEVEPTDGSAFDYLINLLLKRSHRPGHLPTIEYVTACRPYFVGNLCEPLLKHWTQRVQARLGSCDSGGAHMATVRKVETVTVLVKVFPDQFSAHYFVEAWVAEREREIGSAFYSIQEPGIPLQSLPELLRKIVKALFDKRKDIERSAMLQFELFLPLSLLVLPVDRWEVDIGGDLLGPFGERHCLSIRSFERVYGVSFRQTWPEWHAKWEQCLKGLSEHGVHVLLSDDDYCLARAHFMRDEISTLFALRPPSCQSIEHLKEAIVAGIPTILWQRAPKVASPQADLILKELSPEILAWPGKIRTLRRNALAFGDPFWHDTTLILDNPEKLPPDWDQEQRVPSVN